MPFTKLTTALEILQNLDSASSELRNAIRDLKYKKVTPAEFVHAHFPNVGTKSHAVYAITRVLITRDGSTSATVVVKHVKELLRVQHESAKQTHVEAHEITLIDHDIKGYLNTLVIHGKVSRTPGGTIT